MVARDPPRMGWLQQPDFIFQPFGKRGIGFSRRAITDKCRLPFSIGHTARIIFRKVFKNAGAVFALKQLQSSSNYFFLKGRVAWRANGAAELERHP